MSSDTMLRVAGAQFLELRAALIVFTRLNLLDARGPIDRNVKPVAIRRLEQSCRSFERVVIVELDFRDTGRGASLRNGNKSLLMAVSRGRCNPGALLGGWSS